MASLLLIAACTPGDNDPEGPQVGGASLGVEGAHEHGVARMGVAVDGLEVLADLQIPGAAVFGFEHAPASEEEWSSVTRALSRMEREAGGVIVFPGELGCTVDSVEVQEAPGVGEPSEREHEQGEAHHVDAEGHHEEGEGHYEEGEGHHEEGEGHHEDGERHHEDGEGHHENGADAHSEVRLVVSWSCGASPEGNAAGLGIPDVLPKVAAVDLTIITSEGQAAGRVDPGAAFRF